jgi:hypothetical protein
MRRRRFSPLILKEFRTTRMSHPSLLKFGLDRRMEYDTSMSDRIPVKLRSLPDGGVLEAWEIGWERNIVQLTLPDEQAGFSPGVPAEIESDSKIYLGAVWQCSGSTIKLLIEHSLDRARLSSLQAAWR